MSNLYRCAAAHRPRVIHRWLLRCFLLWLLPLGAQAQCNLKLTVVPTTPQGVCAGTATTLTAAATVPGFNTPAAPGFDWRISHVHSTLVQADGKIIVSGRFSTYEGFDVPDNLIRLNPDGSLDTSFNPGGAGFNSSVDGVGFVVQQASGKLLVSGDFTTYNNQNVPRGLIRLNADGTYDNSFGVYGAALNHAGFGASGSIANPAVNQLIQQPDGKLLVGGPFETYNGGAVRSPFRLDANGMPDAGFTAPTGLGGIWSSLELQPDGKVLVSSNRELVRLQANGAVDPSFNVPASNGVFDERVTDLIVQPDGKVLVSGHFTSYRGSTVPKGLIRLNGTDGSLDASFNGGGAGFNEAVGALLLQPDGKVLVNSFTAATYNGTTIPKGLVRLHGTNGSLDASFNGTGTGFSEQSIQNPAYVGWLTFLPDGSLLAVGYFDHFNGQPVPHSIVRLNTATGLLTSVEAPGVTYTWTNGATGPSITVTQPGLYGVTASTSTCSATHSGVRILPPVGKPVRVTPPGPLTVPSGSSLTLTAAAYDPGFVVDGVTVGTTGASAQVVVAQPDGKLLVGGNFITYRNDPATPDCLMRLHPDGSRDNSFNAGGTGFAGGYPVAIVLQADGKILVGGRFTSYNGATAPYLVRLNPDGSRDLSFTPSWYNGGPTVASRIAALAVQADGKVLVGGSFNPSTGGDWHPLLRLNPDGSLDNTYRVPYYNRATSIGIYGDVNCLALQADGKVLLGGGCAYFVGNNTYQSRVLRLNHNGSIDASFHQFQGTFTSGNGVHALAVQPDGKILAGGDFVHRNAPANTLRTNMVRLNVDGSGDESFDAGGINFRNNNMVYAMQLQADGKVLIGGTFTNLAGATAYPERLLRLQANGALDASFNAGGSGLSQSAYNMNVTSLAIQPDGKIVAAGYFDSYNGNVAAPDHLLRLNANGTLNDADVAITGAAYTWNTGATGATLVVNTAGSYSATAATAASPCGATSTSNTVEVSLVTATMAGLNAAPVVLFPNPAQNQQSVQLRATVATGMRTVTVTVLNSLGQVVASAVLPVQGGQVNSPLLLEQLPAGVYSVCLPTGSGVASKRLVVL